MSGGAAGVPAAAAVVEDLDSQTPVVLADPDGHVFCVRMLRDVREGFRDDVVRRRLDVRVVPRGRDLERHRDGRATRQLTDRDGEALCEGCRMDPAAELA